MVYVVMFLCETDLFSESLFLSICLDGPVCNVCLIPSHSESNSCINVLHNEGLSCAFSLSMYLACVEGEGER